ncbi:monofunctional biosynthetic peptidoglycan transglycosylase [Sphingobacterium sp. SGG-5]|uniref:monofunctional biosynthetic peptidoglycan transglycosylase n=1 Tax=Sphingobacterium sp. SGG-5 TaxID=2710881 RepID=UPI0013EA6DD6|nr:monofunctional biosynthetic peptidoglycan transglycosylase [Sphingobacterium sp. SGG-5]NGM60542.1 monofunctional biosynthetic peptidoglycan transglycosylase [Sphingobacterium sp. SGG-5]
MAIQRKGNRRKGKRNTRWAARWKTWAIRITLAFFGITIFWVLALKFIHPPITYLMIKRGFEWKAAGKGFKIEKDWMSYDELSDNLKRAAIAGEDAHFLTHHGFDTDAIWEAFEKNRQGKKLRGGSTISQQVAKNVFLWPGRSWLRKGLETYFTFLIEICWSKKRILEVYLNVIEMGQGVYGAEAAAHYYFNKSARSLSKKQAALIIAILPNPRNWDARRPSNYVNSRANSIVRYMGHYKIP